jgi:hypothetical protein
LLPTACLLAAACGSAGAGNPTAGHLAPTATPDPSTTAGGDAEENYSNRIKWKTASELNNFGYDVYRGDSPEGPFERLNPEVIEGAGTTDVSTAYEYVDRTIDPYGTYYYYVESISMNGVRERFTPIGKAPPKIVDESEETAAGSGGSGESAAIPTGQRPLSGAASGPADNEDPDAGSSSTVPAASRFRAALQA